MQLLLAILSAIVLLLLPSRMILDIPTWFWAWSTAVVLFACFRHAQTLAKQSGGNPWIDVAPLTLGWIFVRYGLGALIVYYWDQYQWVIPGIDRRFHVFGTRQNLDEACRLCLLAGLGFYCAFRLRTTPVVRMLPDLFWPANISKLQRNAMIYAPFGLFILFYVSPRLPLSIQFMVSLFATITYALIVMISYWWFSSTGLARTKWMISTLSVCGIASLFGLTEGQVGQVFIPFMMVFLGYAVAKRTLPFRFLIPLAIAGLIFLGPFLTAYKHATYNIAGQEATISERMEYAEEWLTNVSYRGSVELAVNRFVGRLALIEFPAVFSLYYPDTYRYAYGRSFLIEFSTLVPRIFWPDKPQMSIELNRYTASVGMIKEGEATSAVFDAIAEYHVNFGPLGVFLLSMVHALYLKILFEWLTYSLDWLSGIAIHLMIFNLNFDFFGVGQMLVSHAKLLPVAILLLYILGRDTSPQTVEEGAIYART